MDSLIELWQMQNKHNTESNEYTGSQQYNMMSLLIGLINTC